MKNRESEARIHGKNEQLHIKPHELMGEPEGQVSGYPEEQIYLDYDEMYGPDAYMGDQYPMTDTGHIQSELPNKPFSRRDAELSDELIQEQFRQAAPPPAPVEEDQDIVHSKQRLI